MAVPKFFDFFVPLLRVLDHVKPESLTVKDLHSRIADDLCLTEADKAEMLPSGSQPTYKNRIHWAIQYLKNAGLIENTGRGIYKITSIGENAYAKDAAIIDLHYLDRFPSFIAFHKSTPVPKQPPEAIDPSYSGLTPIEQMETAYAAIRSDLAATLLSTVKVCSPDFFEHLVVDLLLAMGYGYDSKESGHVIGRSGDGGIDGIINEDKLGFSSIYVQAKRWTETHSVGSPEVQAFVGAMVGKGATKGLFITTSQFSKAAQQYVLDQKTVRVILIDGEALTKLMIDFNVGVSTQATYTVKRIDNDYFEE